MTGTRAGPDGGSVHAGAVVLAAGAATRFGAAKLTAPLRGRPILDHVIVAALAADLDPVVVVLGHHRAAVETVLPRTDQVVTVVNETLDEGLASSIRCGLRALADRPAPPPVAVLLLGDEPGVRPAVIAQVAAAASSGRIARARYDDGAGHPVAVPRARWDDVARWVRGDRGLGPFLPHLAVDEVVVPGPRPSDVDRPGDLGVAAAEGGSPVPRPSVGGDA